MRLVSIAAARYETCPRGQSLGRGERGQLRRGQDLFAQARPIPDCCAVRAGAMSAAAVAAPPLLLSPLPPRISRGRSSPEAERLWAGWASSLGPRLRPFSKPDHGALSSARPFGEHQLAAARKRHAETHAS